MNTTDKIFIAKNEPPNDIKIFLNQKEGWKDLPNFDWFSKSKNVYFIYYLVLKLDYSKRTDN